MLAYATPPLRKGIPKWVKELWAFFKLASVITMTGLFLLALVYDDGHVSGGGNRHIMVFYLSLVAIGLAWKCLRAESVTLPWRLSTALAVPFFMWTIVALYVELAYMRDGWTFAQLYPDARGAIAFTVVGLAWLAVSGIGFSRSRRRGRAARLNPTPVPPPAPG